MPSLIIIFCSVLSVIIAVAVLAKPLFIEKQRNYYTSSGAQDDFDESVSILETIAELETDYLMDKISKEDFENLSLEYQRLYLEKKG